MVTLGKTREIRVEPLKIRVYTNFDMNINPAAVHFLAAARRKVEI